MPHAAAHLVGNPNTKPSAWSIVCGSATGMSVGLAGACILASTSAGSVSATWPARAAAAAAAQATAGGCNRARRATLANSYSNAGCVGSCSMKAAAFSLCNISHNNKAVSHTATLAYSSNCRMQTQVVRDVHTHAKLVITPPPVPRFLSPLQHTLVRGYMHSSYRQHLQCAEGTAPFMLTPLPLG